MYTVASLVIVYTRPSTSSLSDRSPIVYASFLLQLIVCAKISMAGDETQSLVLKHQSLVMKLSFLSYCETQFRNRIKKAGTHISAPYLCFLITSESQCSLRVLRVLLTKLTGRMPEIS